MAPKSETEHFMLMTCPVFFPPLVSSLLLFADPENKRRQHVERNEETLGRTHDTRCKFAMSSYPGTVLMEQEWDWHQE